MHIGTMIEVYLLENPTSPAKKTQVKWHIDDVKLKCNFYNEIWINLDWINLDCHDMIMTK